MHQTSTDPLAINIRVQNILHLKQGDDCITPTPTPFPEGFGSVPRSWNEMQESRGINKRRRRPQESRICTSALNPTPLRRDRDLRNTKAQRKMLILSLSQGAQCYNL
ncbi:hypothetical protein PO909_032363 [Leuciscus waleckii]